METHQEQYEFTLELDQGKSYSALVRLIQVTDSEMRFTFGRMEIAGVSTVHEVLGPQRGRMMQLVIPGLGESTIFVFRGRTAWDDDTHVPIIHADFFVLN